MSLAVVVFALTGIQAQENKTIKKESTTKRVVVKDGSAVKVVETKSTDTQSGAVIVEGNNQVDQESSVITRNESDKKTVVDEVYKDDSNKAKRAELKMQQQAKLDASIKEQQEIAAKKRAEYEAKQAQLMQKELAERRAKLEARPEGMSKLKKD